MDAITTLIDLNGTWASGGVPGPVISVNGESLSVNMAAYQRPSASGTIIDASDVTVTFPDDKTYTGKLQSPNTIVWSNNSAWTKVSEFIATVIDLNGTWASGGKPGPIIQVYDNDISIDMSAYKRPTAHGSILDPADITVTFPDDKTYTARIEAPGTLQWSNNSAWTKVPITVPAAPTNFHITQISAAPGAGASTITVGWTDNSNNETGFTVHWNGVLAGNPTDLGAKAAVANAVTAFFPATLGYTYTIYVEAWNQAGTAASNSIVATVTAPRTISVSKQGTGSSTSVVVTGSGFTPNAVIVIKIVPQNLLNPVQFSITSGGDGKFTASKSFSCVSGILLTFTAFEDANPTGTLSNAVTATC